MPSLARLPDAVLAALLDAAPLLRHAGSVPARPSKAAPRVMRPCLEEPRATHEVFADAEADERASDFHWPERFDGLA